MGDETADVLTGETVQITGVVPGHIDEIIAHDVTALQLEQMNDSSWFLCITDRDGTEWRFQIGATNGRSHVQCVLQSKEPSL